MYIFEKRNNCPVCLCNNFTTLYTEKFTEGDTKTFLEKYYGTELNLHAFGEEKFTLLRCKDCTLIFQQNILSPEGMEALYEKIIDPQKSLNKRKRAKNKFYKNLLNDASVISSFYPSILPSDISVLDFGMGWGHWCLAAKAWGYDVMGAELSEKRLEFAKKEGIDNCDPYNLRFENYFDYINTDQVFEHLSDPLYAITKLSKALKINGIIKIFVPNTNRDYLAKLTRNWVPRKDSFHPLEHINCFNRKSLNTLAKNCSLKPVELSNPALFKKLPINFMRRALGVPGWYYIKKD